MSFDTLRAPVEAEYTDAIQTETVTVTISVGDRIVEAGVFRSIEDAVGYVSEYLSKSNK